MHLLNSTPSIFPAFKCNACGNLKFRIIPDEKCEGAMCSVCSGDYDGTYELIYLYSCRSCRNESEDRATIMECMRSHGK